MDARDAYRDLLPVDWARSARDKERYWCEAKRRRGASHGLEVADELRRFAQAHHPHWPTPEERRLDHAAHLRLAHDLDRIPSGRHTAPR